MKRPTLFEGVAVALLASLVGTILFTALSWLYPDGSIIRLLIAFTAFGYLLYLLMRSEIRTGRIIVVTAWTLTAAIIWLLAPPLTLYLIVHVGLIWLIRSLYFHNGFLSALADLALNGFSLAAAIWAMLQTESLMLSIWCFFLSQSLFVAIPSQWKTQAVDQHTDERFSHAHAAAEAALRKLTASN